MLSLALACGGLAASEVGSRVRAVEARVGAPVPVLVAAREVGAGEELRRADLAVRDVPEAFAPPDALAEPQQALGAAPAAALARGSYVTAAALGGGREAERQGTLRKGERAVEVGVAGAAGLADGAGAGSRVDVLVSTEPREGPGRSFLALEDVELLDLRAAGADPAPAEADEGGGATPSAIATLRVTLRQAVYLTAAHSFAREVRLLPRPPGDRSRAGRAAVSAGGL